ncbi:hypothetical protein [Natrialba asiatica]|uniref:Uncharacterized protein n=1 Tax=Natrialba asiatica (strain ATCC 700177 / DSM 12278 / JCM 9576 / FERM P-10747 / NBRC 102637 / 172P1) TaxID=29540 RepID=M0AR04_NATA1|nr:hypothetical protein [Natrialba asiatica]ELZ00757.1 hypothetical protein C481_11000 [Natrialba asiatica DSM 12278]
MDAEFLAKSLKRVFDECQEAQNREDTGRVGTTLVEEFNDLLEKYKSEYQENKIIQEIEPVGFHNWSGSDAHPKDVQQVKQNCLKIADSLELSTDDFREPSTSESFTTIHFEANQRVEQSVSVENVLEMINQQMMPDNEKEELKDVVEEFTGELEKENPDKSKLERLLNTAREYQPQIALQLGAIGLNNGIDVLLGAT